VTKKNDATLYIELKIQPIEAKREKEVIFNKIDLKQFEKPIKKERVSIVKSSYEAFEHDLKTFDNFKKSIYFNFCDGDQEEFFIKSFESNPFLFSSSINIKFSLCIQFGLNLPAWESDFKNKLIPYLSADTKKTLTDQEALNYLSKEKYWFRINRYFDNGREQLRWALFNEEYLFSGYVDSINFNFVVLSIAIQRKRKNKSNQKSRYLSEGTFLYDSKIVFSSPFQDKTLENDKEAIFKLLDNKTKAFEIIRSLKEESGALLMEEGLSLQIFDRFLEFQEYRLKKGNVSNRVWIDAQFKSVTSNLGSLSIEFQDDLEDLCEGNNLTARVTIRTIKLSTKKSRNEEFVFFSDATLEVIPQGSRLHFKNEDVLLDDLKQGFYVEPKISTTQFQVQREVLQDFFAKKIKLRHIESLLLKPEKIEEPEENQINFFNDILKETEQRNPQNNQVKSVKKSVGNKNIFLIQGPPGTGKTTVIAEIVQQLVSEGEKVLVTSQTHIAVDNVLEKLSKIDNLSLLRLGDINKVKEELISFQKDKQVEIYSTYFTDSIKLNILLVNKFLIAEGNLTKNDLVELVFQNNNYPEEVKEVLISNNLKFIDSLILLDNEKVVELPKILEDWINNISNELETLVLPLMYNSIDVVFATCIGVRIDRELSQYNVVFDTVIIDEAGKANLSESIAAISMAKKVILVGDQKQLPPYIDGSLLDPSEKHSFPNSKFGAKYIEEDIQHALKTSFFEFLVNRIEGNIFPKSNIEMLNYQHRMHPHIGEFISEAFYDGELKMGEKTSDNILPMPSPFDKQIVFIDTSSADNPFETKLEVSVRNDTEAQCISQLVVPNLMNNGLTSKDFAIVAPYKSQVSNIKNHLSDSARYDQIEVSTLDSFQGMEFDVIVFSFTRSAYNTKVGFLDDARRLNVAFSRAKKKLILIGNSETLTDKKSHYDQLFDYTGLFKKLVKISKNPNIGNFVNVTDFTDLKSRFQSQIKKYKIGISYSCKLKLTFENDNYVGHIFFINGTTLEGMFKDNNKDFVYDLDTEYKMYISDIDFKNERVQLSPKQSVKPAFFKKHKIGDKIKVSYKQTIKHGHLFQINDGFDCFMYEPKKLKNYKTNEFYHLYIVKIDHQKMKVSVDEIKTQSKKLGNKVKRNFRGENIQSKAKKMQFFNTHQEGDLIEGSYSNSTNFGHFFRIENSFDGLVFDNKKKYTNLVKGKTYKLQLLKLDSKAGKLDLKIINI
jgi:superfamily I DNA and/or RNA helicase